MSVPFNVSESSNNLGAAQVMAGMVSAIGAFKENTNSQHCTVMIRIMMREMKMRIKMPRRVNV